MLTREIKKRIHAIEEIARITNVMYLLAASRMAKVKKRRQQAQRYFKQIRHLVLLADAQVKKKDISLLTRRPTQKIMYVVITPDQGFCGGLPTDTPRLKRTGVLGSASWLALLPSRVGQ